MNSLYTVPSNSKPLYIVCLCVCVCVNLTYCNYAKVLAVGG